MKNYGIFLFLAFLQINCVQNAKPQANVIPQNDANSFGVFVKKDTTKSYEQCKIEVKQLRQNLRDKNLSHDSLSVVFTSILVDKIIPYWYGTHWSFDGHTTEPQKGEIACGYFISTVLTDTGLNMNKYKFAQQLPINEAKTFSFEENVLILEDFTRAEHFSSLLKNTKDGVYFIGFGETHVGFLLRKKEHFFLLHSKYENAEGVKIESLEESNMFSGHSKLCLSPISDNPKLLQKWLQKEEVKVVAERRSKSGFEVIFRVIYFFFPKNKKTNLHLLLK
jgi:hypothetical protein